MRKNILSSLFPLAAVVSLTGTGFGVWVFNNNNNVVETVTGYGNIVLTPAMVLNDNGFEIKKLSVLNLNKNYNDMLQEIKFMLSINSLNGLNITDELEKNPITINFETTCTVLLPEALGNYIKLTYVEGNQGKVDNSDEEVKGTKQLDTFNGPQNNFNALDYNSNKNPFKFEVKFNGAFKVQASDFSENKEKEIKYNFGATYKYAWIPTQENIDYKKLSSIITNKHILYEFTAPTFSF